MMASASATGWQAEYPVSSQLPRALTLWHKAFDPVVPAPPPLCPAVGREDFPRLGVLEQLPVNASQPQPSGICRNDWHQAPRQVQNELLMIPCVPELVPVTRLVTFTRVAWGTQRGAGTTRPAGRDAANAAWYLASSHGPQAIQTNNHNMRGLHHCPFSAYVLLAGPSHTLRSIPLFMSPCIPPCSAGYKPGRDFSSYA